VVDQIVQHNSIDFSDEHDGVEPIIECEGHRNHRLCIEHSFELDQNLPPSSPPVPCGRCSKDPGELGVPSSNLPKLQS
jgi:hypothetical protein